MKVALVHHRIGFNGGLETRMVNYMNCFLERGDEVTVIAYKIDPGFEIPGGVNFIKMDLSIVPKFLRNWSASVKLAKILKRHSFEFVLSMGRNYYAENVIVPATHKGYMKHFGANRLFKDWLDVYLDKKTFQNASHLYACSEMIRQEVIKEYGIDGSKVHVLNPPLNTQKFSFQSKPVNAGKKVFLFPSTGHKTKGIRILEEVFKDLDPDNFELWICGTEYRSEIENIVYKGYQKDLAPFYHQADFTILPAYYEPFGQVISESLACGTPVLVSNRVGAKEIVNSSNGIILNDQNPKTWIKVIQKLRDHTFEVDPDLVEKHALSTANHVQKMIELSR